ncbi:DUF4238 domain-containing protein [Labrys wisconsinensis]|uniref:DUF4238 domain-containing protein n=1 Tax=Labrys wisconsinensis TaxID=425677 RepID=A0ABU0JNP7_9HYPH|nr:DUF4238 domain-containing protein [Labrys wisconsinensis]MDQ0475260.1 hypothetical protein [Labrys wisconsinensis]
MSPENQHWVSKFLVKNFADKDGRVFRLDVLSDQITKPPPKYAAAGPAIYDHVINGVSVSFEDRFEKIETKAAPVIREIIRTRSVAGLTKQQRISVARLIATQSFRTDAFQRGMVNNPSPEQFAQLMEQMWRSSALLADMIERRHWVVMTIEGDDVFYLGDNPVVLQRTRQPSDGSNLGFDVPGVEAFLPLSPKAALYMPCPATSALIISTYEEIMKSTGPRDDGWMADYIIKHRGLYVSLVRGIGIRAIAPYVENLNYLQCSWSSAAIYSQSADFSFARKVFSENPQYRGMPTTALSAVFPIDGPPSAPD